jgi:CDP-2,3-bis-(O-geranylgeranyl)-sn-glycerol synthase
MIVCMSAELNYRVLSALLMVTMANMAPWVSGRLLRGRWSWPLDCGLRLANGTRLLGDHKTWRGVLAGELGCTLIGGLLGYSWSLGIAFASLSLAADAASSFLKRRLHLAPGSEVLALDQLPEALLPLLVLAGPLGISMSEALVIAVFFLLLDIAATPLRHPAAAPHP